MEVLHPRCAGLDVHKDSVMAAVRCVSAPRQQEVRRFATTTAGLLALADWLTAAGCTHVAMEATGVYCSPSGMCSNQTSPWCSPTRSTSATCPAARPT